MRLPLLRHPLARWLTGLLLFVALATGLALAPGAPLESDPVLFWNLAAFNLGNSLQRGTSQAREMAMVHLAIHDALNSIRPRYARYAPGPRAPAGASPEAAIAAAARTVLLATVPGQAAAIERDYRRALAGIPDGRARAQGLRAGEAAAQRILALRADDGADRADRPFLVPAAPGVWEPTPPARRRALLPDWAKVRPFLLHDPAQVLPAPPPALASARYARDYAEVAMLGGRTSVARTAWQAATARFWSGNVGGSWNEIARDVVHARGAGASAGPDLDAWDSARVFALLNAAIADGFVAGWHAKYRYHHWRPVTAIARGDEDGNPATRADPAWMPLLDTPEHPEYPSTHSVLSAASASVLRCTLGGDAVAFQVSGYGARWWRARRRFGSFSAAAREVAESRVYAGAHFRSANEAGLAQGRAIGELACARLAAGR